ncbi:NAD-dependent epimerase/dehydratase family protein [Blautia massiliensis (ex Durand et al. 2017)]|uniref:NAD-dependent epimerase/dehydratase family protein n=1 Tax=Blautia massiliensis (ex Durand et al. 2017) TaxID=1737424 RepID=UPI00241E8626|nr:NAD(P)-dependent oxidoreductase [Blautia massiliensis (ex Durand et al. 2017)]MBN2955075.1 NAD(P)-dependent oxidoreductase [Blautia massiliensis (ex Durand et al. 2017)]
MYFGKIIDEDIQNIINSRYIDWEQFKNKNFFITGSTGLIGSALVRTIMTQKKMLKDTGKVYLLVRSEDKAQTLFGNGLEQENVILLKGDIRDKIVIDDKIDYIIHAASVTTSKYMITNPVETLMTSISGTDNILQLAIEHDVKSIVYLSSMEMYGTVALEQNPITEEKSGYIDVLNVRSSYSEGKRACENLCASYAHEYNVPVVIARLSQIFGAGVSENETKVYATFAKSAIRGEDIILHTKGETMGNYCYISDCIGALLCLLTRGKYGEAYNIVNSKNTMLIKEMAAIVVETLGKGKSKMVFDIPADNLYGYAPETKLELCGNKMKKLGWYPKISLAEMYKRMVQAWEINN